MKNLKNVKNEHVGSKKCMNTCFLFLNIINFTSGNDPWIFFLETQPYLAFSLYAWSSDQRHSQVEWQVT